MTTGRPVKVDEREEVEGGGVNDTNFEWDNDVVRASLVTYPDSQWKGVTEFTADNWGEENIRE